VRISDVTKVTVVSDLSTSSLYGTIYYHWYLDGDYCGRTTAPYRNFQLKIGDQGRVEVVDTIDPDFDSAANAPTAYPARRTLSWVTSTSSVDHYRVEQKKAAGAYSSIAKVFSVLGQWTYSAKSERLDDLTEYTWRIVPVDSLGNDGTPYVIGPELIVRTPDSPDFTVSFSASTTKVTFTAA
jgi:hypothetical protein